MTRVTKLAILTALVALALQGTIAVGGALSDESDFEPRNIDGTGNNEKNSKYGSAGIQLLRLAKARYADGISEPPGAELKSAREISNLVASQSWSILNSAGASDMFWQWGQFLDHDTDLTTAAVPPEPLPIAVPRGDPFFDPDSTGTKTIDFVRSIYDPDTGTEQRNPRQQLNLITSFIDASNVYGSDAARANALRLNDGTGKLKSTEGGLYLPYNTVGLPNAGGSSREDLYLAGDVRANEQIGLTAMHTLFMREHNRLCDEIARTQTDPPLSGDEIYQRARKRVGAYLQVITYNEFLPVLLGPDALSRYSGYRPEVNPSIANEFSTAAYRFGHSMLSPTILRVDEEGNQTYVPIANAFFNPTLLKENGGIDSILRGLAGQTAQEVDTRLVDGVRNFLFGPPGAGGFDLASLNIQRVRDHGLSSYIRTRNELGALSGASAILSPLRSQM